MSKLIDITGKPLTGEWGYDDENGTGIPVIRTTNFTNIGIPNLSNVVTRKITKTNIEGKYLKCGDILIEKSGGSDNQPVGRVIYFDDIDGKYLFNNFTGLLRVIDNTIWFSKYVFYALYANYVNGGTRKYENKTTGLHNLQTNKYVNDFEIEDISMKHQKLVCINLDKITDLIDKHNLQLQKLDELVKARFVEMFGDYKRNNKCFQTMRGSDLFKFSSGKFLQEEKRTNKGISVYGGNGIAWYTTEALIEYETIIIGRVGAWCGNIHKICEPVWITDNAIYIKEFKTNDYNIDFLVELMKIMDFHQYADFSGQPKITQKPLETIEYIVPPLELQNQFADFVSQVDKQKAQIQKSLERLELLKKALMQKYFG